MRILFTILLLILFGCSNSLKERPAFEIEIQDHEKQISLAETIKIPLKFKGNNLCYEFSRFIERKDKNKFTIQVLNFSNEEKDRDCAQAHKDLSETYKYRPTKSGKYIFDFSGEITEILVLDNEGT